MLKKFFSLPDATDLKDGSDEVEHIQNAWDVVSEGDVDRLDFWPKRESPVRDD